MNDVRKIRALVVNGEVSPSLAVDAEHVASPEDAVPRLTEGPAFDVVLLGPRSAPLDAIQALQSVAAGTPVVVLPRRPSSRLDIAIQSATRNPHTAAASARRVALLLPNYLARRADDVAALSDALERSDFELIARTGHNMRGNGVSFGFPELSDVGADIETAAHARDVPGVKEGIERLRACVQ